MSTQPHDSDSSSISPGFADLVANNGGSATFVGKVRDAAEGSEIPDKFKFDGVLEFLSAALRTLVLLVAAVSAIVRFLH